MAALSSRGQPFRQASRPFKPEIIRSVIPFLLTHTSKTLNTSSPRFCKKESHLMQQHPDIPHVAKSHLPVLFTMSGPSLSRSSSGVARSLETRHGSTSLARGAALQLACVIFPLASDSHLPTTPSSPASPRSMSRPKAHTDTGTSNKPAWGELLGPHVQHPRLHTWGQAGGRARQRQCAFTITAATIVTIAGHSPPLPRYSAAAKPLMAALRFGGGSLSGAVRNGTPCASTAETGKHRVSRRQRLGHHPSSTCG
jgi:hypothetical protein